MNLNFSDLSQKAFANISFLQESTVATAAFVQQVLLWLNLKVHNVLVSQVVIDNRMYT